METSTSITEEIACNVTATSSNAPLGANTAYIYIYMIDKEQDLLHGFYSMVTP
jgi:hypothetical protein